MRTHDRVALVAIECVFREQAGRWRCESWDWDKSVDKDLINVEILMFEEDITGEYFLCDEDDRG